ncbi:MAG: type VI secretion system tube protein Hcp [Acidobacteria bacterium]|nr:type VI secretion system tube protein Hcp [Acidobacteriota bacterium]
MEFEYKPDFCRISYEPKRRCSTVNSLEIKFLYFHRGDAYSHGNPTFLGGDESMAIYLKFEGIEGTGTGKYKGWIELQSCQIAPERGTSNALATITCTKFNDSSSPGIFSEAAGGSEKKATIVFVKGTEAPFLSVELEKAYISAINVGRLHEKTMETFWLSFDKVSYTTSPTAASKDPKDAKDKAMWNFFAK